MPSFKSITSFLALALTAIAAPTGAPIAEPAAELAAEPMTKALQTRDYGTATYYTPSLGACGWYNTDSDYVVALSAQQWNNGANPCGKWIGVWYENGNVVTVQVVDKCMGCDSQSIDLSTSAFVGLVGSTGPGHVMAAWWFD